MFKSAASKMKFIPEDGMKVTAHGRISSFVRDGTYQLYCDGMEPDGVGALYIAFEQLKKKLEYEGLFDPARKKPLPKIPTSKRDLSPNEPSLWLTMCVYSCPSSQFLEIIE